MEEENRNKTGRPLKFKDENELQAAINLYFESCDSKGEPFTIEGLCVALDIDRKTLLNYEKREGYEMFFHAVKKAKLKVQENLVKRGLAGDNSTALTIFLLKNNYGYRDQTDLKHSGDNDNPVKTETTITEHRVVFENYKEKNA